MSEDERREDDNDEDPAPTTPTEEIAAVVSQADKERELHKAIADLQDLTTRCEYEMAYVETINTAREKLIKRVADLKVELGVG